MRETLDFIVAYAEGREAWWCEVHESRRWNDSDICEALAGALQSASPCRMVRVLVCPIEEEKCA